VTDAFGGRGGIAQYNRDLLGALAGAGEVGAITVLPRLAPDPVETPSGITQKPPRSDRIPYAIAAIQVALTKRPRLIFCGHLYMAPLGALIARLTRAKLIVQMHGIEAWTRPRRLYRSAVEAADLVLCVSRFTRSAVRGWAAIEPERIVVLPNTIREHFTPGDASRLRAALGVQDKCVLLTVGRMDSRERYKGHDRVIDAIPILVAAGHDVVYLIVGEGDDRERLAARARGLGVVERVRFIGSVEGPRLVEFYRAADLFVMPSTDEGFGIAFLEAMASGTPALGLAVAGANDALADGELGVLVAESELPAAVARALRCAKPQPEALSAVVRGRFGRATFTARACAAIDGLARPAQGLANKRPAHGIPRASRPTVMLRAFRSIWPMRTGAEHKVIKRANHLT
jgi:phosphatidylinositol alpha-1,6-mannosyltransferase